MKVILKADVKGQGKKGDLINASDGYAKNFLLPKGLAVIADKTAINELEGKKNAAAFHKNQEEMKAKELADKLEGQKVTFKAKSGDNGKLFGSITAQDVANEIKMQLHLEVDKKKVQIESIKSLGTTEAIIKVYPGISAKVKVEVLPL